MVSPLSCLEKNPMFKNGEISHQEKKKSTFLAPLEKWNHLEKLNPLLPGIHWLELAGSASLSRESTLKFPQLDHPPGSLGM